MFIWSWEVKNGLQIILLCSCRWYLIWASCFGKLVLLYAWLSVGLHSNPCMLFIPCIQTIPTWLFCIHLTFPVFPLQHLFLGSDCQCYNGHHSCSVACSQNWFYLCTRIFDIYVYRCMMKFVCETQIVPLALHPYQEFQECAYLIWDLMLLQLKMIS